MKLYDVPKNTRITIKDDDGNILRLLFHKIDGMYSYCTDDEGNVVHVAAWVEVEIDK